MKRLIAMILSIMMLSTLLPAAAAADRAWAADIPGLLSAGPYAEGQVIVGVDPALADAPDLLALLGLRQSLKGEDLMAVPVKEASDGEAVLRLISSRRRTTEELLCALAGDDRVVFAEPNYIREAPEPADREDLTGAIQEAVSLREETGGPDGGGPADRWEGIVPHDRMPDLTGSQWGQQAIHTPNFGAAGSNMAGDPVVVAVLDTPVDFSHPDLAPAAFTFTEQQQKALGCDVHGWSATTEDGKLDMKGADPHGTHVAGIIAGAWDGHGISGVASNVQVISLQISTDGEFTMDAAFRCFAFVDQANRAGANIRITNNSWGGVDSSLALDAAVRALGEEWGVVSVFAAGNEGRDLRDYENGSASLARNPYAVLVAASTMEDALTSWSSYGGSIVSLTAPGRGILSAVQPEDGGFYPGLAPDSTSLYEGFEDGAARVTIVQEGAAAENAVSIASDDAQSGGRVLELRLDKSAMELDEEDNLNGVIDLTFHDIRPDREFGQYLGLSLNASGYAVLTSITWPVEDQDKAELWGFSGTGGGIWASCWTEVPRQALQEEPFDLTVQFRISVDQDVDTVCFDDVALGNELSPYDYISGTSQATPMAAGAAAVLAAADPGLTGAELADRLKASVRQTDELKDKVVSGGVLDLDAAGNIPPARAPEPVWPLYDTELPLEMSTGEDPFEFDAQGDWESNGPLAALGDKLYYFPCYDDTEVCKNVLVYDVTGRTWETRDLPVEMYCVSAAVFDGKLAVKGTSEQDDPDTGESDYDEQGFVWIYDPAAESWSEACADGISYTQTLIALEDGLALVGGGCSEEDEKTGEETVTPGVLAAYDPETGAGQVIQTLTTWYECPQAAACGETVFVYEVGDYTMERVTAEGAEEISDALPDYHAPNADDFYSIFELTERWGILCSAGEDLLLVGVLSEDSAADTWLLRAGSDRFEPLLRKTCDTRAFGVAAAVHDGTVYAIGTVWNEDPPRFFRANDLDTLNEPPLWMQFTDVSRTAWYCGPVRWAVDNGVMNGVSDDLFAPNGAATRAMVVTMLWRMAGEPAADAGAPFTDVKEGAWYADAVAWAASAGAVNGTGADTFSPNAPVTREQLAAILYRYAQAQGQGFTGSWMFPLDFPDADRVSDWANEAMHWMVMHGVITGMSDGTLAPKDNATRAQIAAMFQRFAEEMTK